MSTNEAAQHSPLGDASRRAPNSGNPGTEQPGLPGLAWWESVHFLALSKLWLLPVPQPFFPQPSGTQAVERFITFIIFIN